MLLSPGLTHRGAVLMVERVHLLQEAENTKVVGKQVKEKAGAF